MSRSEPSTLRLIIDRGEFSAEPFLFIGIIAVVRRSSSSPPRPRRSAEKAACSRTSSWTSASSPSSGGVIKHYGADPGASTMRTPASLEHDRVNAHAADHPSRGVRMSWPTKRRSALADEFFESYLCWREACEDVRGAYRRWADCGPQQRVWGSRSIARRWSGRSTRPAFTPSRPERLGALTGA